MLYRASDQRQRWAIDAVTGPGDCPGNCPGRMRGAFMTELAATPEAEPGPDAPEPLLRTEGLTKYFKLGNALSQKVLHAVDEVSFTIGEREIVALAGESGSGKSTIARLLARIYKPTAGTITFDGQDVRGMRSRSAQLKYSAEVPMVFQDPFASINPV